MIIDFYFHLIRYKNSYGARRTLVWTKLSFNSYSCFFFQENVRMSQTMLVNCMIIHVLTGLRVVHGFHRSRCSKSHSRMPVSVSVGKMELWHHFRPTYAKRATKRYAKEIDNFDTNTHKNMYRKQAFSRLHQFWFSR